MSDRPLSATTEALAQRVLALEAAVDELRRARQVERDAFVRLETQFVLVNRVVLALCGSILLGFVSVLVNYFLPGRP
ncbi:MAG: hypothetical protein QN178_14045 [Armatimonadota bacterium]|nr:hypothetical protein [Armatimonadota bacterium]